ncbi:MAG: NAD(P)/FAD-dependent oxidoreductase [Thermoplasmata archaeon]
MTSRIVIAGAGVGGIVLANELKSRLKDGGDVTIVERKPQFQFPPSFPWVVMGARTPDQVQKDLGGLEKRGIRVVRQEIVSLDLPGRRVLTSSSQLPFDYLVVALGADYAPETIPGLAARAQHMYDLDSAVRLREKVAAFPGGAVAIGVARLPFKCPAAPYEMALLLDEVFRRRGIRDQCSMAFFTPEGVPLPAAGPEIGAQVLTMLQDRGIAYHPKRRLKEVGPSSVAFEEGDPLPSDLLICVPPHRAPKVVQDAGLTDASGWVPVDPGTFRTAYAGVYAIGDVTAVPTPSGYVPTLPKAGVFASGQAKLVARNLAAELTGKGRTQLWDGYGACFLETGKGKSAFVSGNFLDSPHPSLELKASSAIYHAQKVIYERYWFRHWL